MPVSPQISVSISCIGLYLAEVSTDIFMLEGMAGMGMLPKFFHRKNKCENSSQHNLRCPARLLPTQPPPPENTRASFAREPADARSPRALLLFFFFSSRALRLYY